MNMQVSLAFTVFASSDWVCRGKTSKQSGNV